ncbi:putative O-glycosylation ligase, exosortase A system-associated [Paraglaciecola sp.]|uniref:putative O-glycosylation ligase, exosortase A system-associated n=1 Tax=Paraglaciecola sp. TaxID=1920173 RepID=UPI003EF0FAC8
MKDLIFLLMFLPFIVLSIRNPFIGLCVWMWTVMIVPKNMLWGFASDIRFTLMMAAVTIIGMFISKDPLRRKPGGALWVLLILFLIHTGISNQFTIGSSYIAWRVWSEFFKVIILSTLIVMLLTTRNRIETFLITIMLGIGFNIFFEGLKFLATLGSYSINGIRNSMMTDNNLFALAILMVLPLYMYIIPTIKYKYLKLGFTGLAGLSAITVIGSYSRGGFIGLIIVGWQLFLKSQRKIFFVIAAVIFASSAIYVASTKWTDRIQTIENAGVDQSFLGRITAWKLATLTAMDRPILGGGQDAVQHLHVWQRYYLDIHKFNFITEKNTPITKAKASHSIYFQVLGDAGFVGFFLFMAILFNGWFKSRWLSKQKGLTWEKDLGKAINTSLTVFMISGGLLSLAYYDLLYALLSVLICITRIVEDDKAALNKIPRAVNLNT